MGREQEELLKALRDHCSTGDQILVAEVVSVNQSEDTVEISMDGMELADVRLRSIIDSQGNRVVVYPAVGSTVLIGKIGLSSQFYVQAVGVVDKVLCRIGEMKLEVTDSGFVYNEGSHTTANADILKRELNKLSKRVDDLLNALTQALPTTTGGIQKADLTTRLSAIVNKEDFSSIENAKIKHG